MPKRYSLPFLLLGLVVYLSIILLPTTADAQTCTDYRYRGEVFSNPVYYADVIYSRNAPDFLLDVPTPQNLNVSVSPLLGSEVGLIFDKDLMMDIMMPPASDTLTKRPAYIWAFPGGFVSGTKEADDGYALLDTFARRGFVAAKIDYRIGADVGDEGSLLRAVYRGSQDMSAAIRFFKENADQLGVDTNYIFIGGSSAGAFCALHASFLDEDERAVDALPTYEIKNFLNVTIAEDLGLLHSLEVTKINAISGSSISINSGMVPGRHLGKPRGVVSCWGSIGDLDWLDNRPGSPDVLIFHGTGDDIVHSDCVAPFSTLFFGIGGFLINAPVSCGGEEMDDVFAANGIYVESNIEPGAYHEYWGTLNGDFDDDWLINGIGGFGPDPVFWPELVTKKGDFFYTRMQPATPVVSGATQVCQGETATYTVPSTAGSIWCWDISNGSIVSVNPEANTIDVQWNTAGVGTLEVREITCNVVESDLANYNVNITAVSTPTGLSSTSISATAATFNWTNSTGVTFEVDVQVAGTNNWTTYNSNTNSVSVSNLDPCTAYEYRVRAVCGPNLTSAYSTVESFNTPISSASVPSGFSTAVNGINGDVTVNWSVISGLTYEIEYRPSGGSWQSATTSNPNYTLSNLDGCTEYEYRVKSICPLDNSETAFSAIQSFTTAIDATQVPTGLAANPNTANNTATVSWTSAGAGLSYNVQYRPVGSGTWQSATTNSTSSILANLSPCTAYEYQVQSQCTADGSTTAFSSTQTFTLDIDNSLTPTSLASNVNAGTGDVTLTWAAQGSGLSYEVEYAIAGSNNWQAVSVNNATHTLTGLDPCTTYEYRIASVCPLTATSTTASATMSFVTNIDPNTSPNTLNATANVNDVSLTWAYANAGSGISYEVDYRPVGGSWQTVTATTAAATLSNLNSCTDYEYVVRAICTASVTSSANSTTGTFTSPIDASATPTALAATPNANNVSITWAYSGSGSSISYEVDYRPVGGSWQTVAATTSSTTLSNLNSCTEYEYVVRAICTASATSSSNSTTGIFTSPIDANVVPTALAASPNVSDVSISWTYAGGGNGIAYEVDYRPIGGTWQTVSASTNALTLSNLNSCEEYEYVVRAVCAASSTSSSSSTTGTFFSPIDASVSPSGLTATNNTANNTLDLAWTYAGGAGIDYTIEFKPVSASTWQTATATSNDLSIAIANLVGCVEYEYRVQANCAASASSSAFSTTGTFFSPINAAQAPSGLTATPNTATGDIDLTWTGNGGDEFVIQYREITSANWTSVTTTNNSYTLPSLAGCSEYEVTVATNCTGGGTTTTSPTSNTASFSTGKTIVKVKALLQGGYDSGGLMKTNLWQESLLPLAHPYGAAPWNYSGTEALSNYNDLPANAVDWVIVEIQDQNNQYVTSAAGILLQNGDIVDYNGTISDGVELCGLNLNEPYYIVVRHRNHLDIMSTNPIPLPNASPYDFTSAVGQASAVGTTPQLVDMGGYWSMRAGDFDGDGRVLVNDYNGTYLIESSFVNRYVHGDLNMDGNVTVADFNLYQPSVAISAVSFVRY